MLTKLSEVVFAETLRRYVRELPAGADRVARGRT